MKSLHSMIEYIGMGGVPGINLKKISRQLLLGVAMMFFNTKALAIDIVAGEPQLVCKGSEVTLGGNPTANGGTAPYTYEWSSDVGDFTSSEANPKFKVEQTTTFKVKVIDADGFECDDEVKIEVIIFDLEFSPNYLLAEEGEKVTVTLTVSPEDREVVWSLEGEKFGCEFETDPGNSRTAVIVAGAQVEAGELRVRVTDKEKTGCYKEEILCIGEKDKCCRVIEGQRTFGPISFTLPDEIRSEERDDEGFCKYTTKAQLVIKSESQFSDYNKEFNLEGVEISWWEKQEKFKQVEIKWTGEEEREFNIFKANLTQVSIKINASENLQVSGDIKFSLTQTEDKKITETVVLKKGLNGSFTYTYNSGGTFGGTWDFSGIEGFKMVFKKQSKIFAEVTAASIDASGNVKNARFKLKDKPKYTKNGFKAEVQVFDVGMDFSIMDKSFKLLDGTAKLKLKKIPNTKGNMVFNIVFNGESGIVATVDATKVNAFNCKLTGTMQVDFDQDFNFSKIQGSDISVKHDDFDQSIKGVGFAIENGEVKSFEVGNTELKYKKKLTFIMKSSSYDSETKTVKFNADVKIPGVSFKVKDFKMSGEEENNITVGSLSVKVDKAPIKLTVDIAFKDDQFCGGFSGKFAKVVNIKGDIVVGAEDTYNYAYFSLSIDAKKGGIPLGNSGLKVRSLFGAFGYNWNAQGAATDEEEGGTVAACSGGAKLGVAESGTTTIGFGLGIGDVANMATIKGKIWFILGESNVIILEGEVNVRAKAPHYVKGTLRTEYTLGSEAVSGTLTSTVKFPPKDGSIVTLNTGDINFGIEKNEWSIDAAGLNGKIFNTIEITANTNFKGVLPGGGIEGTLSGTVKDYTKEFPYKWPKDFDPENCGLFKFGVDGNLKIVLSGTFNAALNDAGITGGVTISVKGGNTMQVKFGCLNCDDGCTTNYEASIDGTLTCETHTDGMRVHGTITFTYGGESKTGEVDKVF